MASIKYNKILPQSFLVLTILGLWKPVKWSSNTQLGVIYRLLTIFSLSHIYFFTITGLIGLTLPHENVADITNDCFMLLSIACICGKILNVLLSRKQIILMLNILRNDPCLPLNQDELSIQNKWDKINWVNTMIYGILTEVTVLLLTLGTFFQNIPIGTLPFNAYIPWNHSHGFIYWLTYAIQLIGVILSANTDIGWDTLVPGFMIQISKQLDTLKYRFSTLTDVLKDTMKNNVKYKLEIEKKLVTDCVQYHITILKLANTVDSTFNRILFFQWVISTIVLCVSVYTMAQLELFSPEFTSIALYLICMLMEIFFFCAAGNEVTLMSNSVSDAIYEMDWTELSPSTVKSLVIIMSRTSRPLIMTCGHFVILSYESFKKLLKISYSTYNVLQSSK